MQRQAEVQPFAPAILRNDNNDSESNDDSESGAEPDRRIRLARHLTRADHPLTARVIANRIWQHHFGTGLVATPSDFGKMGAKPSHPKLLDWLALELIANDWSMKSLHRQILLTKTYQQSAWPRSDAVAVDAECRLLWRYPPQRLEAETIRDSILFVSGKLSLEMHGRGFDFFDKRGGLSDYSPRETFDESGWRRMVYAHKIRMETADVFGAFDCPDAGQMTPHRSTSITPIQALGLFNSPFMLRQSRFFAERLRREAGAGAANAVERGFQLALARPPSDAERQTLLELERNHGLEQVCRVLFNSSEFIFRQ